MNPPNWFVGHSCWRQENTWGPGVEAKSQGQPLHQCCLNLPTVFVEPFHVYNWVWGTLKVFTSNRRLSPMLYLTVTLVLFAFIVTIGLHVCNEHFDPVKRLTSSIFDFSWDFLHLTLTIKNLEVHGIVLFFPQCENFIEYSLRHMILNVNIYDTKQQIHVSSHIYYKLSSF